MTSEEEPMGPESASHDATDEGAEPRPSLLTLRVDAWVLAVAMVVAFAGGFVFRGLDDDKGPAVPAPAQVQTESPTLAPPLAPEQLEGGLPTDHPPIDDTAEPGTDVTTTTGPAGDAPTTSVPPPSTTAPGTGG